MGEGKINGHDVFADLDQFEEDGSRYDSVPRRVGRPHADPRGERGAEPEVNSPQPGGRPPLGDENTLFEFGFLTVDTGAEPREEARDMVLEMRGRAATLEQLDQEDERCDAAAAACESRAEPLRRAIEDLQRQVRAIAEMAAQVETELAVLLEAESRMRNAESRGDAPCAAEAATARADSPEGANGEARTNGRWLGEDPLPECKILNAKGKMQNEEDPPGEPAPTQTTNGARRAAAPNSAPITPHPSPLTPPRKRRGPSKMTPVRQQEVVHYIRAGLSLRQAAAFVGCHHTTIVKAAQRDEQFAWELEKAQTMADALPLVRVIRASQQSWRAAAWLVKNHQPSAALRRERAAERDAEAAESLARLDRLIRQQAPGVEVKATIRGGSVSVELRPRRRKDEG